MNENTNNEKTSAEQDPKAVASVAKKMAAVMGDVKSLYKGGTNRHDRYRYVEAAAVSDMVRELLAKHGLAFIPSMRDVDIEKLPKGVVARVEFDMMLVCGETGGTISFRWAGEATDFGLADKAINKAATAACKYALLKTFVMSTSDEPDADSGASETQEAAPNEPKITMEQLATMKKIVEDASGSWDDFAEFVTERMQGVGIEDISKKEAEKWLGYLRKKEKERSSPKPKKSQTQRAASRIREPGEEG